MSRGWVGCHLAIPLKIPHPPAKRSGLGSPGTAVAGQDSPCGGSDDRGMMRGGPCWVPIIFLPTIRFIPPPFGPPFIE